MGDFTLGCLLGQPDGSMSFDVSSTADPTNVISFDLLNAGTAAFVANSGDQTQSHSSGQGLMYEVYSSASDVFFGLYYHGFENDAYSRWFPAVTTHGIRMDWWARMNTSAFSGTAFGQIWNQDIPTARIPFSETLKLHRIRTSVVSKSSSAPATIFGFISNNASTGSAWVFIDDVLTQTDEIILHPEYTFREQARIVQASHRTQGGDLHTYTWGKYLAFNVPLRFL
ncbi:MAG: hypothetical protein OEZ59_07575, partial [Deltaproteobacteria bacterium]|nr:hypothetical protein [Deltaproteobacteria bacterium]